MNCTRITDNEFCDQLPIQFWIGRNFPDVMTCCESHVITSKEYTHFKEVSETEYIIFCIHHEIDTENARDMYHYGKPVK